MWNIKRSLCIISKKKLGPLFLSTICGVFFLFFSKLQDTKSAFDRERTFIGTWRIEVSNVVEGWRLSAKRLRINGLRSTAFYGAETMLPAQMMTHLTQTIRRLRFSWQSPLAGRIPRTVGPPATHPVSYIVEGLGFQNCLLRTWRYREEREGGKRERVSIPRRCRIYGGATVHNNGSQLIPYSTPRFERRVTRWPDSSSRT